MVGKLCGLLIGLDGVVHLQSCPPHSRTRSFEGKEIDFSDPCFPPYYMKEFLAFLAGNEYRFGLLFFPLTKFGLPKPQILQRRNICERADGRGRHVASSVLPRSVVSNLPNADSPSLPNICIYFCKCSYAPVVCKLGLSSCHCE